MKIKKSRLESGITVISEKIEGVRSFSLGFWVVVGSRNENKKVKGITHFIEHSLFKGTERRSLKEIARALESKGAELDAFTSKEVTCFYSRGLDTHLRLAVDVIADILTNPLFPEKELRKEKGVVKEEIKDNEDSPGRYIFDLLFEKTFLNHPLANSVLGKKEDIESLTRKKIFSYFNEWYSPERIVVTASGSLQHTRLLKYLEPYFKKRKTSGNSFFKPTKNHYKPYSFKFNKEGIFQTHLIISAPTFDYNDRRKYPLLVFNMILGEGMSSILFQKVREEKGLVYEVFSFVNFFSDAGIFGVYLACDPLKIENAKRTVIEEFRRLIKKGLKKKTIAEAKVRLKAKLLIGMESTSNRMMRLGRSEIYKREILSIDEIINSIVKVKVDDVNNVINDVLCEDNLSFIYVGDFNNMKGKE